MKIGISELFVSIQGEGIDVGSPSFFIRTAGCSIGCKYCDTKYSWKNGNFWNIDDIIKIAIEKKVPEIVITGGEPVEEENLNILIRELSKLQSIRKITLETCGHIFRDDLEDKKLKIVLSPKTPTMGVDFPENELKKFLSAYSNVLLKFAVFNEKDFALVKNFVYKNRNLIKNVIVIQPLEVPFEDYLKTCQKVVNLVISDRDFINSFEVKIIPQVHKLIGLK
ncbi:MAG: 7-carboxy-7-deazaguanine synthase QueE [Desulfurobacteriaceae bacterium]